jgi:hypothetical protein
MQSENIETFASDNAKSHRGKSRGGPVVLTLKCDQGITGFGVTNVFAKP